MATLDALKTRIADEIARDDLATQIADGITTAIGIWEGERFWFNEKRFLLPTVAGQEYYGYTTLTSTSGAALSAGEGPLDIDNFVVTSGSRFYTLTPRTHQWMDAYQLSAGSGQGRPNDYAIYADQFRLHPVPDAVYSCTISCLASLLTITTGSASNAWTTEAEPLIRAQVKMMLYRDVLRDKDGEAGASRALEEARAMLKQKTQHKVGTGQIAPWTL